jgi:hypothetical protein
MYDHAEQDSDPAAALTAHQTARTAAAIAACLVSLSEEATEVGLASLAVFIGAAADFAQKEAAQRAHSALQPYGRPSLIWSAPEPDQT